MFLQGCRNAIWAKRWPEVYLFWNNVWQISGRFVRNRRGNLGKEPWDGDHNDGANGSGDQRTDKPRSGVNAQQVEQPTANQGANDAEYYVNDNSESFPFHNESRQPAGSSTQQDEVQ